MSPPPGRNFGAWTTPRVLQTGVIAVWAAAILFLLASLAAVHAERDRLQTIGKDAVPSILAAEQLKVGLSDLDANVVNELLVPAGQSADSVKGYVTRRQEITNSLIAAAENITYGDRERTPLRDLTNALSAYERLAIKARTLHQRGDETGATATYRDALATLHGQLLPAADALAQANTDALHSREASLRTRGAALTALTVAAGVLLLSVLVAMQVFLSRRMRRTVNAGLLAATLVLLLALAGTLRTLAAAREQVRVARDDAFASLSALWQARAIAYDANSDESRWLFFDRDHRPALQQAYYDKTALLLKLPQGNAYAIMAAATPSGTLPAGTTGLFADEASNITFAGEKGAVTDMVRAFGVYYADDERIRALENTGQHAESVRFNISMHPGDSNWAFDQFDQALGRTIAINQSAFDGAVATGFRVLAPPEVLLPAAAIAAGLLAFAGTRPRLREYRL